MKAKGSSLRKRNQKFKEREFERLGGKCPFCQVEMTFVKDKINTITYDHVVALARGGSNALTNGQVMCSECNNKKAGMPLELFVKWKLWLIPRGPNYTLLKTQMHGSWTGDIKLLRVMGKMCLAKDL